MDVKWKQKIVNENFMERWLIPLRILILSLIFMLAVSTRLLSINKFESIIHEFDPWFNFRATKYLKTHSLKEFFNWFDEKTWYPLGRVTGGTLYPGLMVTSYFISVVLEKFFFLPIDIKEICVLFGTFFSGLTALITYFLVKQSEDETTGLWAALFISIIPGYVSRSVAGSYDNEAIAITLMMATFYFWLLALKKGSVFYGTITSMFYFYMVSSWGGYVFITNIIPLHVFILILIGRFNYRLYVSYTTWYVLGTLTSMQIPFVGTSPLKSNDHLSSLFIFCLLQVFGSIKYFNLKRKDYNVFLILNFIVGLILMALSCFFILYKKGYIAPWTGRFYSLWDTNYAIKNIPIIASVSEHQPTTWVSFFIDSSILSWLFPVGVYICFDNLTDSRIFFLIYGLICTYFTGIMVRLILTLIPVVCILSSIAVKKGFEVQLNFSLKRLIKKNKKKDIICVLFSKLSATFVLILLILLYIFHCIWVNSTFYSSPSVVLSAQNENETKYIDDYREAYYWLQMNTPKDSVIASWWDYGYQIGGLADRTTIIDNNTWNNTHIAFIGKVFSVSEKKAYELLKATDSKYVLIIFGSILGFSGDDMNKFLWMIKIALLIWPDEVLEHKFYNENGEFKIDSYGSKTLKESLMFRLSYHGLNKIFNDKFKDRIRFQTVNLAELKDLSYFEEVFTSENFLVRIYRLKDEDNLKRDLSKSLEFEKKYKTLLKSYVNIKPPSY